jgi:hypothetical protein
MKNFKVDTNKNKINLHGQKGICPYCDSENIDYGELYLDNESLYFPIVCVECGNEWAEWHDLKFVGNYGYPLKKKK